MCDSIYKFLENTKQLRHCWLGVGAQDGVGKALKKHCKEEEKDFIVPGNIN